MVLALEVSLPVQTLTPRPSPLWPSSSLAHQGTTDDWKFPGLWIKGKELGGDTKQQNEKKK